MRLAGIVRVLLPVAALLGVAVVPASPATAAVPGYVRLAHLSPDTPVVDVWVTSFRGDFSKVIRGVGYGAVSDYLRLAPGTYTIAMRPPGGRGSSAALLSTNLTVRPGASYTVAGVGRHRQLSLRILQDDLSAPSAGQGRIRVVQASSEARVVDVVTSTGTPIAIGARFPSTTRYSEVPAQQWTLRASPRDPAIAAAETTVDIAAGKVYTVFVLDDKESPSITMEVRVDAAAAAVRPVGSVDTGLGGLARRPPSDETVPLAVAGAALLGLLGLLGLWVAARRRVG